MFRLIKQVFILLLSFSRSSVGKCILLHNRSTLIDSNPNKLCYYLIKVNSDRSLAWSLSISINLDKVNGCIEDNSKNKYQTLISDDRNKSEIKKYKETWNKIKYLTELENNDLDKKDGKNMNQI